MLKQFRYRERLSSKIKAVPRRQRIEPELQIGGILSIIWQKNGTSCASNHILQ